MAGRFLFQKFSSGVSRSTRLLGAHASASARAGAPIIPRAADGGTATLSNAFLGAGVHPAAVSNDRGIHGYESGSRTLRNLFHGAAIHPGMAVPHNHGIHGYAARYLNTVPCSHAAAKIAWTTTGMPSIVINRNKSAFVDSVRVKRTFSSSASNKHGHSWEAILPAWVTEKMQGGHNAATDTSEIRNMMFMLGVIAFCVITWPEQRVNSQSTTACCCNCPSRGSSPKVKGN